MRIILRGSLTTNLVAMLTSISITAGLRMTMACLAYWKEGRGFHLQSVYQQTYLRGAENMFAFE